MAVTIKYLSLIYQLSTARHRIKQKCAIYVFILHTDVQIRSTDNLRFSRLDCLAVPYGCFLFLLDTTVSPYLSQNIVSNNASFLLLVLPMFLLVLSRPWRMVAGFSIV